MAIDVAADPERTREERTSDSAIEELVRSRRCRHEALADIVKQLLDRYGTRERAIEELALENYKLRAKLRELRGERGYS